ncbi:MAG: dihydroorotase [Chitinophagaceae bacterium]
MLIKNGTVIFPNEVKESDILIENRKIKNIGTALEIEPVEQVINAKGLHIFPGLIDIHVHFREPGFEYKEDIESGSKAAVKGGFTQVCCMPNTNPVIDNHIIVSYIRHIAQQVGLLKVHPIGAITLNSMGEQLTEMGKMKQAGAVAFSDDGKPVANALMMRLAMEYANHFGLKCLSHCEDKNLTNGGVINEGLNSTITGLKGIIKASEEVNIAREILLAENLKVPIHICHVSTATGVQLIREAKLRGVEVTSETCPHYFILSDAEVLNFNTQSKMFPPLREQVDIEAIKIGLKDGTIDAIATDHAPHHQDEKNIEYQLAAFGISGIETSFALCITYLYKAGILSLTQIAQLMSTNPAKILNLEGGSLTIGSVADITIADINKEYTIDKNMFLSKGKNTPFHGYKVYGEIAYTIVDGDIKYQHSSKR